MILLIAISLILSLFALLLLGRSLGHTRRGRLLRAGGSFAGGITSAGLGGAGILFILSYVSYERLTDEKLVGVIEFAQTAPEEYTARLMIDGERDRLLTLSGDEWQLDARILTWQPPATILGLDPVYQLERLSGRYSEIDREINDTRTVHDLSDQKLVDLWTVARRFPLLMPGVDAYYGTATYVPMADAARFRVTLSRDALIARPVNDPARKAVGNWSQSVP